MPRQNSPTGLRLRENQHVARSVLEHQAVPTHDTTHSLCVDTRLAQRAPAPTQQPSCTPIATRRRVGNERSKFNDKRNVIQSRFLARLGHSAGRSNLTARCERDTTKTSRSVFNVCTAAAMASAQSNFLLDHTPLLHGGFQPPLFSSPAIAGVHESASSL